MTMFDEVYQMKQAYLVEARKLGKDAIYDVFKEVLDYDGVSHIGFTLYAPYFNDGDPCVFDIHPYYRDEDEEDDYCGEGVFWLPGVKELRDQWEWNTGPNKLYDNKLKYFDSMLDILEEMFGTDKLVKVYKDGSIEVSEYEHN